MVSGGDFGANGLARCLTGRFTRTVASGSRFARSAGLTVASGSNAGRRSVASGSPACLASGPVTVASGSSRAPGIVTVASGSAAAAGRRTVASGSAAASFAGCATVASGSNACLGSSAILL